MKAVRQGGGTKGDEKALFSADTLSQVKGICEIPLLEIPCLCLLGEDNKPHTESLTSEWEFAHQITPVEAGLVAAKAPRCSGKLFHQQWAQAPSKGMQAALCKERDQAAQSPLPGQARGFKDSMASFYSLVHFLHTQ